MTAAVALVAFAMLAATLGARVLDRAAWTRLHPRSGILAWQALTGSVVLAAGLAATSLALPFLPLRVQLAELLGSHPVSVAEHYGTPWGAWPGTAALALAAAALGRLGWCGARAWHRSRTVRRGLRESLALVGRPHPEGFTVVEHAQPMAYCVPGRRPTMVLTRGALDVLTADQRRLVVGHERRHLRRRHHLALACSASLAEAFGERGVFGRAHRSLTTMVEMDADDVAREPSDRRSLAQALVLLSVDEPPSVTLAVGATAALVRVRRLTTPAPDRRRGHTTFVIIAVLGLFAVPILLSIAPAVETAVRRCCELAGLG